MTAEIAILNKEAVALAADSAVTVSETGGQKIFSSANKLFALSKYHPVGVMVFGRAAFMGVPWETLVKVYRAKLQDRSYPTLQQYADDFVRFLDGPNQLFPEAEQARHVRSSLMSYLQLIRKEFMEAVETLLQSRRSKRVSVSQSRRLAGKIIRKHYTEVRRRPPLPSLPKQHVRVTEGRYAQAIEAAMDAVLEKLPLNDVARTRVRRLGGELFYREIFPANTSGIVIAGFGAHEAFPSLVSLEAEAVVADRLKCRRRDEQRISNDNNAAVLSFAQSEMVSAFMEGIDPELAKCMEGYLTEVFEKYPAAIVESIGGLADEARAEFTRRLVSATQALFEDYRTRMKTYRRERHVNPIVTVVAHLPKDELGSMAESLVSLTSFKRRVTMEAETVGGPIDVAVISKGDGFIWLKRKHYFKADLNPQFLANYYRETADGQ